MGRNEKGKGKGKRWHEHDEHEPEYEAADSERSRMCSDLARRPAGSHRKGNHAVLWNIATDFRPAAGTTTSQ